MALPFKILTQTDFTAITLDEAKSQCRLMPSNTIDDSYVTNLIAVAANVAQEYLHWMTSEGTVKQFSDSAGDIQLYGKFVDDIVEVTATNGYGEQVFVDDYSYNDITEVITIPNNYFDIYITYNCGATNLQLPSSAKMGMLMLISTMYNNREDFITGLTVAQMPTTSKDLLKLTRNYVS